MATSSLGGTVQVSLAPGTGFGRYPLFTYGGTFSRLAPLSQASPAAPPRIFPPSVPGRSRSSSTIRTRTDWPTLGKPSFSEMSHPLATPTRMVTGRAIPWSF